jgi:hypothetical protein
MQYVTLNNQIFEKRVLDRILKENKDRPIREIVSKLEQVAEKKSK